jgi:hypothetical protein
MSDESLQPTASATAHEASPSTESDKKGPGGKPVPILGIVALAVYLIALTIFLLHGTVHLLNDHFLLSEQKSVAASGAKPAADPAASNEPMTKKDDFWQVRFWIFGEVAVSKELQLVLLVIFAGALGSLVHALRSLSWYVGNRELMSSWIAMYGLLPFMGAALAVVFYLVIRGGFFSVQSGSAPVSLFGFAALAGLVGMFSEQALVKLKTVAETLFAPGEKGAGHVEPENARSQNDKPKNPTGGNPPTAKPEESGKNSNSPSDPVGQPPVQEEK